MEDQEGREQTIELSVIEFLKENKLVSLLLFVGIFFLVAGGIIYFNINSEDEGIEIITDGANQENGKLEIIVVEVSGEVEDPGVYGLSAGARMDDLLKLSGDLTVNADLSWVEKTINRAAKLTDGQKVYIPRINDQSNVLSANNNSGIKMDQTSKERKEEDNININTATHPELEDLWGIGPAYAKKIIEQRPYSDTSELVSKKIIPQNVFEKIKDQITVY